MKRFSKHISILCLVLINSTVLAQIDPKDCVSDDYTAEQNQAILNGILLKGQSETTLKCYRDVELKSSYDMSGTVVKEYTADAPEVGYIYKFQTKNGSVTTIQSLRLF